MIEQHKEKSFIPTWLKLVTISVFIAGLIQGCSTSPDADNTRKSEQQPASSPPPVAASKPTLELPPLLQPGSGITIEEYAKAVNGDPKAMYDVGSAIEMAEPATEEEYKKAMQDKDNRWYASRNELAFQWIERSAKAGYFEAQEELGALYESGWGVDSSFDEARKWYQAAYRTAKSNKDEAGMEGAMANLEQLKDDIANDKRAKKEMAEQDSRWGNVAKNVGSLANQKTTVFNPMKDSGGITPTVDTPETFDLLKDLSPKDQEGLVALTMQGKLSYLDPHATIRVETVKDEQGIAQVTILSGAWIGQKRWVPTICIQSANQ